MEPLSRADNKKERKQLNTLSREESIQLINRWGSERKTFVFLISFEGEENLVMDPQEAAEHGFYLHFPACSNHRFPVRPLTAPRLIKHPISPAAYRDAYNFVQEQIHYGNSFLVNLTFPTEIGTDLQLRDIFASSRAPFRLFLDKRLVVFSPERFIRIQDNFIHAHPMKGTMDASIPGAFHLLSSDPKEDAEHHSIVDLIRNDLSMVAKEVRVRRFKYIEKISTHQGDLLQMSSEIRGQLPPDHHLRLGDILFRLLPAGSICGAPKQKTLQIIRQAEKGPRGYYTGIFGYFDGRVLDSAVAIRYMEKFNDKLLFRSGGGITSQSVCQKEYEELLNKVYVPLY